MAFARTFTERITTALLSFVATGMAIGGIALAGLGLTLRQIGVDIVGMPVIVAGLIGVGAVLAISGGVSLMASPSSASIVPPLPRIYRTSAVSTSASNVSMAA